MPEDNKEMRKNGLVGKDLVLLRAPTYSHIREAMDMVLQNFASILPGDPRAKILLKPNLNANMIALTGNTTDLRILSAVIIALKARGYENITIGEGTNSGFYRSKIDILSLLRVKALADHHQVRVKDLNYAAPQTVFFKNARPAEVARDCVEADCFINLPKLKTHFETGMSVCLKNLIGCLVGQSSKKKVHEDLPLNILKLNEQVKPHLHIVDGLIAMEGLGPTRGVPVPLHLIMAGQDPFFLDYLCCRLAGFDFKDVRPLVLAHRLGLLTPETRKAVEALDLTPWCRRFAPPRANPLASFIHHPKFQKFFLAIRNTPFFNELAQTQWFGKLLFLTQLRQDVFLGEPPHSSPLQLHEKQCDQCGLCADFCPQGLDPAELMRQGPIENCLSCFYCFMVCPREAIHHVGSLGFLEENMRRYARHTRKFIEGKKGRGHSSVNAP